MQDPEDRGQPERAGGAPYRLAAQAVLADGTAIRSALGARPLGVQPVDWEDGVMEVVLRALLDPGRVQGVSNPAAWLIIAARNACIDRQRRSRSIQDGSALGSVEDPGSEGRDREEQLAALRGELRTLAVDPGLACTNREREYLHCPSRGIVPTP